MFVCVCVRVCHQVIMSVCVNFRVLIENNERIGKLFPTLTIQLRTIMRVRACACKIVHPLSLYSVLLPVPPKEELTLTRYCFYTVQQTIIACGFVRADRASTTDLYFRTHVVIG